MTESKLVTVFSGTMAEADLVKASLEDQGITAYLVNENIGTIAPHYASAGVAAGLVAVSSEDAQRARELILSAKRESS